MIEGSLSFQPALRANGGVGNSIVHADLASHVGSVSWGLTPCSVCAEPNAVPILPCASDVLE